MSDASLPAETWAGYLQRMTSREGWSVQRLADDSGVARSRLFKYMNPAVEVGVTVDTVLRIAAALGDQPINALRAAAGVGQPSADDEVLATIERAPVDDSLKAMMRQRLTERREREREAQLADLQAMIDLARGSEQA